MRSPRDAAHGPAAGFLGVVELDGRDMRMRTVDEVIARAQALTRRLLGDSPAASVDAFLAERRSDAEQE